MESGGNVGDTAEVAKLSKKKKKKKKENILRAQTMSLEVVWAHFMFVM